MQPPPQYYPSFEKTSNLWICDIEFTIRFMDEVKHAAFRLLKLMGGLVLIVLGAGLFVLFTGELNVARSNGSPMAMGYFFQWWRVLLVLDLLFLSLILSGVKLAGFGWSVF